MSARPPAASGGGQVPLCPAATGLPSAEGDDAEADAEEAPPTPAEGAPALWLMDRPALPVRLRLLGGLDLIVAGQDAEAGSAAMAESWRLFLAYLLLQRGQPRTREEIQLAFWPDATPQQARDNFHARRKGLARYFRDRPGLPPVDELLPYDRDTGHYRADPTHFWVDALAFEEALVTSPVLQPGGHRPEGGFAARGATALRTMHGQVGDERQRPPVRGKGGAVAARPCYPWSDPQQGIIGHDGVVRPESTDVLPGRVSRGTGMLYGAWSARWPVRPARAAT